jgi:hypothetical protein
MKEGLGVVDRVCFYDGSGRCEPGVEDALRVAFPALYHPVG